MPATPPLSRTPYPSTSTTMWLCTTIMGKEHMGITHSTMPFRHSRYQLKGRVYLLHQVLQGPLARQDLSLYPRPQVQPRHSSR